MGKKNGKQQTTVRKLPVQLAPAERERKLREHISLELDIEKLVAKRSEINVEIRPKAKRSQELVHELDAGTTERDVECEVRILDDSNEVAIVRLDTGEEVERRTMTANERQGQWDWSGATEAAVEKAREQQAEASAEE